MRDRPLIETPAEHLIAVLRFGSVSTNLFLRRFHNFALGMNWLPWPILPKKLWPAVRHGERRSITRNEHAAILAREPDPELRAFYAAIESVWRFLNRPGLDDASSAVQGIELRSCLESVDATFLRENIDIPSGATGAKLVEAALERFCQLLG